MSLPFSSFLLVWSIVALNTMTPGPNVVNTIATAMSAGRRAGLGAAAGVGIGVALWCLASTLGFAEVFAAVPRAEFAMQCVATALLGWLALRALRLAWAGLHGARRGLPQAPAQLSYRRALGRAILISAANPKVLTTWLSIVTLFPVASARSADIAVLALGSALIGLSFHSLYATVFSSGPAARFYLRAGWVIYLVAGAFFAILSAAMLTRLLRG
ncbi:LysE family translocator [Pseudorhodobacter sp.]|uniref:LysE family translocator n=1 Tax=Pseudorhodobacter sp. TaxID=1934400 RepID=UPI0026498853|nr:LysE family transporter [Pseudorhodobacter sp.]MDN5786867.1 LysE family transporter [Pseudorhodobacter sp.]